MKAIRAAVLNSTGINRSGRIINTVLFSLKSTSWTISDAYSFHAIFIMATAERYPKLKIKGYHLRTEEHKKIIDYFDTIEKTSSKSAHEEFVKTKSLETVL